jgi:hypothetical protein
MNIRKGAFRLWVVTSVLFALVVIVLSYSETRDEFRNAHTDWDAESAKYGGISLLPVLCPGAAARGMIGTDYTEQNGICWYSTANFRRLYPEYNDLGNHDLSEKVYAKAGQSLKEFHPWHRVMTTLLVALGYPLAALVLGWSLFWAFAGFKQTRQV